MAPNNSTAKPEPASDKAQGSAKTDDHSAHHSFFRELVVSAAYSGVEQPSLGVSQLAGNDAMDSVKNAFAKVGIEKPPEATTFTSAWYAQTVGGALGMAVPYALTKFGLGKIGAFGKVGAEETNLLSQRASLGASLRESSITGMVYGTAFTPTDEKTRQAGLKGFLADRLVSGVGSAVTFSTLTAGSVGFERLGKSAVITESRLSPVLRNKLVAGVVSGLPAGFVSSEYESLTKKHEFASGHDIAKSMLSMATVGGTFGTASIVSGRTTGLSKAIPRESTAAPEPAVIQTPETGESPIVAPRPAQETVASTPATTSDGARSLAQDVAQSDAKVAAPTAINPNEFSISHPGESVRAELSPQEQDIWRQIQTARTPDQYVAIKNQIEEHVPLDNTNWFTENLDRQSRNLTDHELNILWPVMLENDPNQGYRIAKTLGPERTTKLWQQQLQSVQETGNANLAGELANTLVYISPEQQLSSLQSLLHLEPPPSNINMMSLTLPTERQMAAAQMLVDKGVTPYIETSRLPRASWTDWALDLPQGEIRDAVLQQLRRRFSTPNSKAAGELNDVLRVAQSKAGPGDYGTFSSMLSGIVPKGGGIAASEIRATALQNIDPKFIGRLIFEPTDWTNSDKIAEQNPGLMKALAVNSKNQSDATRSSYIASMMTAEPPLTIEQIASSIADQAKEGAEGAGYKLTTGDIRALTEQGPPVPPEKVPAILSSLKGDVLDTFQLNGNEPISKERLVSILTLASSIGKANPAAFESSFKEPVEAALADNNFPYARRLEAARALGELQRNGFEGAGGIQMPELRMGKLVELAPEQQTAIRTSVEKALYSRDAIKAQLGAGPLGRLLPSIFGDSTEGGIVGRQQHSTHDNSLDHHVLDVVDKAAKDPAFAKLMPKDQVNVLWASLLHDVGKRENMVDLDHNWTSTSITWGILRTLGYPDSRIQRITDIMGKDFDLSYDPDNLNSVRLADQKTLDGVVNSYRHADALNMVAILNRSDIKSVKDGEAWWTPEVSGELDRIQAIAQARVNELNRHLLPVLPSELPQGFGASVMSDYNVFGHSSEDIVGTLKHRSTMESPEYSISVSLLTPENRNVYYDGAQELVLLTGPFEHIAQASRENLSTGTSVGWDRHVQLVDQWASDRRGKELAQTAEAHLEGLGIPPARNVAPENFPRLAQLRRVLGQFDNSTELRNLAGPDDPYVRGAEAISRILTTDRNGATLKRNNEIKLNNPIVSGVGILRHGNQPVYFEGLSAEDLQSLWHGNVPSFVSAGAASQAPAASVVVRPEVVASAKKNNLPIVILNDASQQ
jgi:hypothetical protein